MKLYIPKVKEIVLGLEYYTIEEPTVKRVLDANTFIGNFAQRILDGRIKVKILDGDDLKDLGFVPVKERDNAWSLISDDIPFRNIVIKEETLEVTLYNGNMYTLYDGDVYNVIELLWIMERTMGPAAYQVIKNNKKIAEDERTLLKMRRDEKS